MESHSYNIIEAIKCAHCLTKLLSPKYSRERDRENKKWREKPTGSIDKQRVKSDPNNSALQFISVFY